MKKLISATTLVVSALALSGCVQTVAQNAIPTPATTVATQGGSISANGLRQFPTTISGGDGFQANPTNDASFATLINAVRADANAAPLAFNQLLDNAAQSHSKDMLATGNFSHTGTGNTDVGARATAAGYVWTAIGENIAKGQTNENIAMNGWVNSPLHQANNINPVFKEFGLARAGSGANTYWTLVFGAR